MKEENNNWFKLDNAGKLFASSTCKNDEKVFRVVATMKYIIDPIVLQNALLETLVLFPMYKSTLRAGFFWYYLEETDIKPIVREEYKPICSKILDKDNKSLLFEVTYFHKRINLEVHHSLSDGTGAMDFLKELIYNYIKIKYNKNIPSVGNNASNVQMSTDSFDKYYNKKKKFRTGNSHRAYQLKFDKAEENSIIEGIVNLKQVLEIAHKKNVSLTVLIASILIYSVRQTAKVRDKNKPIILSIPVNLRNYFESSSTRNFFNIVQIGYSFKKGNNDIDSIIEFINAKFDKMLNKDSVEGQMNRMAFLEHNLVLRAIPLPLKDFFINLFTFFTDRNVTLSLSNVGVVKLDKEYDKYVSGFSGYQSSSRMQAIMISYKENLSICFSSNFISKEIEKNFFRTLSSMGVDISVITSEVN
ncbi:MAG: hypothetical protein RSB41_00200 [Bacilli bacterium]